MRLARGRSSNFPAGRAFGSRRTVMALCLSTPGVHRCRSRLVEVIGVDFLLRVDWDRADGKDGNREHQGRYS